jgi:transcriptional regulator with XRE-family HTH domain
MRGAELRSIRERLGWTQARLAAELDVAPNTVARWEREEIAISHATDSYIRRCTMTKRVKVRMKSGEELTYSGITTTEAAKNRLRLFEAQEVVADFDKGDITSWYEVRNSD